MDNLTLSSPVVFILITKDIHFCAGSVESFELGCGIAKWAALGVGAMIFTNGQAVHRAIRSIVGTDDGRGGRRHIDWKAVIARIYAAWVGDWPVKELIALDSSL
jgi:hypothetical protein